MGGIRGLLGGLWTLVKKYPVRAQALTQAVLGVATAFGLEWSAQQVGAVMILSAAFLAFLTEQAVTPVESPVLPAGTAVTVTTAGPSPDRTVHI